MCILFFSSYSLSWLPRPHSVLIIGWWGSNPRTAATRLLYSVPFYLGLCATFPCHQIMDLVPLYPPTIFTRVPCPPGQFTCAYSLSPPIASSPSVCRLVFRPPPAAPVVTRRTPVWSLQPSDWRPKNAMMPLVACPASQCFKVCPAWPVRLVVIGLVVGGGA